MNYDIKFNEWQEMSLKKDVEKIVSILDKKKTLEISVLWEAFLAFLAMALDHADIHKGTLDRPPGKQQKSGVELGAAGAGQCERGRSSG